MGLETLLYLVGAGVVLLVILIEIALWFLPTNKLFHNIVIVFALLLEVIFLLALPSYEIVWRQYAFILPTIFLAWILDEPLRKIGGPGGHLFGAALQNYFFFYLIPRWVEGIGWEVAPYIFAYAFFVVVHFPNWPLTAVIVAAGFGYVAAYSRLIHDPWVMWVMPLLTVAHYLISWVLIHYFHMNMRVGRLYCESKKPG